MDVAYDHIQEETLSPEVVTPQHVDTPHKDLNTEVREAYTAISTTPWGMRLGGFLSQVKKQGESYYEGARQELTAASSEASKSLTGLTKNISLRPSNGASFSGEATVQGSATNTTATFPAEIAKEASALLQQFGLGKRKTSNATSDTTEDNGAVQNESLVQRLQANASARLKKVQAAEDAADEALERFGMSLKNFLRDAVTVAPPSLNSDGTEKTTLLFESKDAEGRRIIHTTRFDAQLHVIHTTATSFTQDPQSEEYPSWKEKFSVESKTSSIAKDLDKYEELRRAMEKIVPEKVDYANFWTRYYFLRHVIETEDQRRKELLQKTRTEDEEVVKWDDDEDESDEKQIASDVAAVASTDSVPVVITDSEFAGEGSRTPTKNGELEASAAGDNHLRPAESRRSNEHSVADSDASYDILSGPTSRGPGTPKEEKEVVLKKPTTVAEEDDEDDWE